MDQPLASTNELVERRLVLMRELAGSLERAYAALAQADFGEMDRQTARQERLCKQLGRVTAPGQRHSVAIGPLAAGPTRSPEGADPASAHWSRLRRELRDFETRVAQLNYAYGALLRRARRTVDIFCRVLMHSGITYVPPVQKPPGAIRDQGE
jgi:hypothetical protein